MERKHTPEPWQVDACRDANGYYTIRKDDGTLNGNTEDEVIATVYIQEDAERTALCVTAMKGISDPVGFMQDYYKALEGLERIGWPCRLHELPDSYNKLRGTLLQLLDLSDRVIRAFETEASEKFKERMEQIRKAIAGEEPGGEA